MPGWQTAQAISVENVRPHRWHDALASLTDRPNFTIRRAA